MEKKAQRLGQRLGQRLHVVCEAQRRRGHAWTEVQRLPGDDGRDCGARAS